MKTNHPPMKRGQTLVEFALVLPLLLIIATFIFDFGRAVFYYSVIYNAAREGARYGITRQALDRTITSVQDYQGIIDAARLHVYGIPPNLVTVTANKYLEAPDQKVETLNVRTTYTFFPVTPFVNLLVGNSGLTLSSESKMFLER